MLTLFKLRIVAAILTAFTVAGIIIFWPSNSPNVTFPVSGKIITATVVDRDKSACQDDDSCHSLLVSIKGERVAVAVSDQSTLPNVGSTVNIQQVTVDGKETYQYYSENRTGKLRLLLILFVVLAIAVGRWRGVRALIGLGLSIAIIFMFALPALTSGHSPFFVAIITSFAVMIATIVTSHGTGIKSVVAMLGSALSLIFAAALTFAFSHWANLISADANITDVSLLPGLYIAGVIIATMGILDDLTVTQSATALALRQTDPSMPTKELIRRTLDVGHDHIGAVVNTLALALLGSSLPIFLIVQEQGLAIALASDTVVASIAAILIGSIALVIAMPITTVLAGIVAHEIDPEHFTEDDAHHHHH